MLPTKTAIALAKASKLDSLFKDALLWEQQLGHFQRFSLVSDYDTAVKAIQPYLSRKIETSDKVVLNIIHDLAKTDILGIAMERLMDVVEGSRSDKDKIAAATILNELYGDKELVADMKLTDRLMINLVGS